MGKKPQRIGKGAAQYAQNERINCLNRSFIKGMGDSLREHPHKFHIIMAEISAARFSADKAHCAINLSLYIERHPNVTFDLHCVINRLPVKCLADVLEMHEVI